MKHLKKISIFTSITILYFCQLLLVGCAHQEIRTSMSSFDTPGHHVFSGTKLLEAHDLDSAMREFNLALGLDPTYPLAHRGRGLVLGYEKDFERAFKAMSKAKKYSKHKDEEALAYVGFMRLYTLQKKNKKWMKDVENNFDHAVGRVENMPEALFYMGIAYKEANRLSDAAEEFKKVMVQNREYAGRAEQELKLVLSIERAAPGTKSGKNLANTVKVTRADLAALLADELKLDRLFERVGKAVHANKSIPTDIKDHFLRSDIETVLQVGLRGLKVFHDGTFHPDEFVTRAAFAMVIEDIIATITHDSELATRYIGNTSPFSDVRADAPFFNAVMVCSTRGILETENLRTGAFEPDAYIRGAEALLAIRKLKEELSLF